MKPIFQRLPTLTLRLILFSVISVVLMTLDQRDDKIDSVRSALNELAFPIYYLASIPTKTASWARKSLATRSTLVDDNKQLKALQLIQQAKLQRLQTLEAENVRLHKLLSSAQQLKQKVLIAEMIEVDLDPYRQNILIDKGSNHNVFVGQVIIDALGIMGQITHVSRNSSTALLISDPSHSIPVRVIRNGLRTIATGIGSADLIRLKYIPGNGDIEIGDTLVSSGLGGRFPRDLPVAVVSNITRNPGEGFANVYAKPSAQLDRSHEVLLVWQDDVQHHPDTHEIPLKPPVRTGTHTGSNVVAHNTHL